MSLSSVHSCAAAASTLVTGPRPRPSREDDGHACHGHPRGGGQLREALVQAFQSLGVDLPQRVVAEQHHDRHHRSHDDDGHEHGHRIEGIRHRHQSSAPEPNEPDADPPPASALPSAPVTARTLRSDLHDFLHELFQAVRGAYEAGTGNGREAGNDVQPADGPIAQAQARPGTRLAIGLTALVSQVAAGQTPAGLQSAFDLLMNDLKAYGARRADAPADEGAASPTLQQVLGALQQRLGYGSSANDGSAVGHTIDLAA